MACDTGNSCGSTGVGFAGLTLADFADCFGRAFFPVEVLGRGIETISYIISATMERGTHFPFQRVMLFSTRLWKWPWKIVLTLVHDA
jgi:hypothetical protein